MWVPGGYALLSLPRPAGRPRCLGAPIAQLDTCGRGRDPRPRYPAWPTSERGDRVDPRPGAGVGSGAAVNRNSWRLSEAVTSRTASSSAHRARAGHGPGHHEGRAVPERGRRHSVRQLLQPYGLLPAPTPASCRGCRSWPTLADDPACSFIAIIRLVEVPAICQVRVGGRAALLPRARLAIFSGLLQSRLERKRFALRLSSCRSCGGRPRRGRSA